VLLGKLIEKMRCVLSVQHLKDRDCGLRIGNDGVVRARIEWDDAAGRFCSRYVERKRVASLFRVGSESLGNTEGHGLFPPGRDLSMGYEQNLELPERIVAVRLKANGKIVKVTPANSGGTATTWSSSQVRLS
jgi:hypothetical protein